MFFSSLFLNSVPCIFSVALCIYSYNQINKEVIKNRPELKKERHMLWIILFLILYSLTCLLKPAGDVLKMAACENIDEDGTRIPNKLQGQNELVSYFFIFDFCYGTLMIEFIAMHFMFRFFIKPKQKDNDMLNKFNGDDSHMSLKSMKNSMDPTYGNFLLFMS